MNEVPIDINYQTDRRRMQLYNQHSWEEAASDPVLRVHCREFQAELYKSKLGSGSKGKCIKFQEEWLTPSEFEARAGRGSSKDWKRSIRYGGDTLQKLIEYEILTPHAISCTCSICSGDGQLRGPVRLFTPYKRKRKTQDGRSYSAGSPADLMMLYQSDQNILRSDNSQRGDVLVQMSVLQQMEELLQAIFNVVQQIKIKIEHARIQQEGTVESAITQVRIQCEAERKQQWVQRRMQLINAIKPILNSEQEAMLEQYYPVTKVNADRCAGCGAEAPMKNIAQDESLFYCGECQKLGGGLSWIGHSTTYISSNKSNEASSDS